MKASVWVLFGYLLLVSVGCVYKTTANLYPVEGPLSEIVPLPVLQAEVRGINKNTGSLSLTMPDGEFLEGTWSSVAPRQVTASVGFGGVNVSSQLQSAWASVYGTTIRAGNVPGINRGSAFLVGERGTNIEVFFETGSGTANGQGVAIDNRGNIYRLIF